MTNKRANISWRLLAVLFVLALVASACSSSDSDSSDSSDSPATTQAGDSADPSPEAMTGDVTLIKGPHSATEAELEQEIIDDFNKTYPDINVEYVPFDWPNMVADLTAGFASGNPPDVPYLVDIIYPQFAVGGQLQEMSELVNDPDWADERNAINDFAWDIAKTPDGQIWGVPVLGAVYNIFINVDLLREAGVLETWDDSYEAMMEAAKATTSDDVFGFAQRTSTGDFAWWDWYPYIHNAGGDVFNEDMTACGLDNPDTIDAMQFLIDIHTAGVTPPIDSVDRQGLEDLFRGGKIAILHEETPLIASLQNDPVDFEWTVAAAPPGPKAQTVMGNFGILGISEGSDSPEASWEFIKHWASAPTVQFFAEATNLQVVRNDLGGQMWQDNDVMTMVQEDLVPMVQGVQVNPYILEALQRLWPVAENAYRGNLTGEEAIGQMCAEVEKVLNG